MDLPKGWNKRLEDLTPTDHGDGRPCITGEETEYAREYERRLLRPWARFPRDGDVYEALHDHEVSYLTHWSAPFTGGGTGILPKGTIVRVQVFDSEPVGVGAEAIGSPDLEARLVPEKDRQSPKYAGYSLSLSTEELNRHFRLIEKRDAAT